MAHDKHSPNETGVIKTKSARTNQGKIASPRTRNTTDNAPSLRRIPISTLTGIHEDVPKRLVNSFPLELDDPRQLSTKAIKHLISQHPIGVVPVNEKKQKKHKATEKHKYAVITGFSTWTALQLHLNSPSRSGKNSADEPLRRSSTISVLNYGALNTKQISELATLDLWLSLAMHLPLREARDETFREMQKTIPNNELRSYTPGLSQQKRLADALNKNRTAVGKKRKQTQKRIKTKAADKPPPELSNDNLFNREETEIQE